MKETRRHCQISSTSLHLFPIHLTESGRKSSTPLHKPSPVSISRSSRLLRLTKFSESGRATPTMAQPTNCPVQISAKEDLVPPLQIQILYKQGRAPTRGSAFAAGYDLYSAENSTVPAKGKAMISTGIAIAVPVGTCKCLRHPRLQHPCGRFLGQQCWASYCTLRIGCLTNVL